jgi:hypothetical protein
VTDPAPGTGDGRRWTGAWVEVVSTVVLALAALAVAWSGYQASRWTGEQAKAFSRANAARVESTRWSNLANSQTEIDVATFTQWVDSYARNETALADFYRKRFRKEFRPAVKAWIATRPLRNPDAPLTPFATPEYHLAASAEAERLEATAGVEAATASRNIQRSTNYVLGVVLFSSALFFGGISTPHREREPEDARRGPGAWMPPAARRVGLDLHAPDQPRDLGAGHERRRPAASPGERLMSAPTCRVTSDDRPRAAAASADVGGGDHRSAYLPCG